MRLQNLEPEIGTDFIAAVWAHRIVGMRVPALMAELGTIFGAAFWANGIVGSFDSVGFYGGGGRKIDEAETDSTKIFRNNFGNNMSNVHAANVVGIINK